jgi:microsomal dipeptidase-like Zn-dependent dipeptidase
LLIRRTRETLRSASAIETKSPISGPPNGLEDVSKVPALVAAPPNRGYSECDVKKILGENHLRVIREVTAK